MYKLKIAAACLCLAVLLGSCKKDFFDINDNPNQVTEDKMTCELILPAALNNSGAVTTNFRYLNRWMGYWSYNPTFSLDLQEVTYNVSTAFIDFSNMWNGYYDVLFDFDNVEKKGVSEGLPFYSGVAKVMKARLFQDLVDAFGNVPYSQAFQSDAYATPRYDKGKDIYAALLVSLDSAISLFKTKPVPSKAASVDIMYQGNATLWIRYANTLRLRLLIRQSEVPGFDPSPVLAKIIADGGMLGSGQTADVNPGYENGVNKQSPFYGRFGFTPTGTEPNTGSNVRANNYLLGLLKGNNDPRLSRLFRPAVIPQNPSDPFRGTTYGAAPDASLSGTNVSYVGPGLAGSASQSQWLTTSVESLFLLAEAVVRGWMPGSEQTAYENAVRESFLWLGVPNAQAEATTYLSGSAIANWSNAGSTLTSKVQFLAHQKYLAMAGMNPQEAWNDYKRLGVPSPAPLSVHPGRVGTGLPVRLLYPASEYSLNSANVLAEGTINLFTSKVFWDQ